MSTTFRQLASLVVLLALMLAAVPVASVAAQGETETPQIRITQVDNSQFPKVTVYVSVTNAAGEPVAVDPNGIELAENGQVLTPESTGGKGEIGALTSLLVVDVSGSMSQAGKLQSAKAAALAYIDQMRPGDQAGLVTFNTTVKYVQPVTTDRAALKAAINKLQASDDTAMYDALRIGTEKLKDVTGRKAIIVLTDGMDNVSKAGLNDVIQAIGPGGLSISTVGLGNPQQSGVNSGLDETGLRTLSERAGGVYAYANKASDLQGVYERYARTLQSEYRLTYTSPSTLRDGVNRSLTVKLSLAGSPNLTAAQSNYNPGGVLPEVAQTIPWPLFLALLGALLLLFFIPQLLGGLASGLRGAKGLGAGKPKRPQIKLK